MENLFLAGLILLAPFAFLIANTDSDEDTDEEAEPIGTEGSDVIDNSQNTQGQLYDLQGGNDVIQAGLGDDTINAGSGGNQINPGAGNDLIAGSTGPLTVSDNAGDDTVIGSETNDWIRDRTGNNLIDGGAGNDRIEANVGSTVTGGDGIDRFDMTLNVGAPTPLVITDFEPGTDFFSNLHLRVSGTQTGALSFEERSDGQGANILFGDNVIAEVMGASRSDLEAIDIGNWILEEGATFTSTSDAGNDTINGSQGADVIDGGLGDDSIFGNRNFGAEGDMLFGGEGDDTLVGFGITERGAPVGVGEGFITEQSSLFGGAGDDVLRSIDSNVLTGGDGTDVFDVTVTDDTLIALPPASDITDFVLGEDTLVIGTNRVLQEDDITIQPWPDGMGADVLNGGQLLVRVTGGQNLTLADLVFERGT